MTNIKPRQQHGFLIIETRTFISSLIWFEQNEKYLESFEESILISAKYSQFSIWVFWNSGWPFHKHPSANLGHVILLVLCLVDKISIICVTDPS